MGLDMNALLAAASKKVEANRKSFVPLELNEWNVQAIFDRCLAKDGTQMGKIASGILFSRTMGYSPEDEVLIRFDKAAIQSDRKNILYLYGQMKNVHMKKEELTPRDAFITYRDVSWTDDKEKLLELLYLGCTKETLCIIPFYAKTNSTSLDLTEIKPTLSPKDPAFPEWWEQHKSEWEG